MCLYIPIASRRLHNCPIYTLAFFLFFSRFFSSWSFFFRVHFNRVACWIIFIQLCSSSESLVCFWFLFFFFCNSFLFPSVWTCVVRLCGYCGFKSLLSRCTYSRVILNSKPSRKARYSGYYLSLLNIITFLSSKGGRVCSVGLKLPETRTRINFTKKLTHNFHTVAISAFKIKYSIESITQLSCPNYSKWSDDTSTCKKRDVDA